MNPASLLARITTRARILEIMASAYQRISPEDVVHALGLVNHTGAVLLLRVKWAGQEQFSYDLERMFWFHVIDISNREKWPYPVKMRGQEFYRNMSRLALAENISPNICMECGGSGIEIIEGKLEDCPPCRGSGKSNHSDRSRARMLGMPWPTYQHHWQDRYKRVQQSLDLWESIGLGAVSRRLESA